MVGLNTDPTTDGDWQSIDFAFYARADGIWDIRESGANPLTGTAYTAATLFGITYDGANVRYYVDGVLVRTVGVSGLTLFMDSSFHTPGAAINSLDFGPGAVLAVVDTSGIGNNAVTKTYTAIDNGADVYTAGTVPGAPNYYLRVDGAGVPAGSVVRATLTSSVRVAAGGTVGQISMVMDWGAGTQQSQILDVSDTIEQSFTVQKEFTALPSDTAWILTTRVNSPGSATTTFKNTTMHVEVIKR
jgi:hypothetical protein